MNDEVTPETITASLAALVEPLREQLRAVELKIVEHENETRRYMELRKELRRALVAVDPNFVHPNTTKRNGGKKKNEVSAEKVNEILADIRRHAADYPEGFTATALERDLPGRSQSTYAKALNALHDRGDIRLDHRGRGGANYWKLVG